MALPQRSRCAGEMLRTHTAACSLSFSSVNVLVRARALSATFAASRFACLLLYLATRSHDLRCDRSCACMRVALTHTRADCAALALSLSTCLATLSRSLCAVIDTLSSGGSSSSRLARQLCISCICNSLARSLALLSLQLRRLRQRLQLRLLLQMPDILRYHLQFYFAPHLRICFHSRACAYSMSTQIRTQIFTIFTSKATKGQMYFACLIALPCAVCEPNTVAD